MREDVTAYLLPPVLIALARRLMDVALERHVMLASAESCTGGLVASCLTELSGSSRMFERGFVTYSNEAKSELLGVPAALITANGAVSPEVAAAMAEGALANSKADIAVSTTGVAGPDGGTKTKPVGMVCFGLARRGHPPRAETQHFEGNRAAIRLASVEHAIRLLLETIER